MTRSRSHGSKWSHQHTCMLWVVHYQSHDHGRAMVRTVGCAAVMTVGRAVVMTVWDMLWLLRSWLWDVPRSRPWDVTNTVWINIFYNHKSISMKSGKQYLDSGSRGYIHSPNSPHLRSLPTCMRRSRLNLQCFAAGGWLTSGHNNYQQFTFGELREQLLKTGRSNKTCVWVPA